MSRPPGTRARAGVMPLVLAMPLALAMAAEAGQGEPPAVEEFPPEIERLLTETSDPEEYAQTERCLSTRSIRETEVLDDRHIVFEMRPEKYYVVQFRHSCHRLNPRSTLVYETRDNRLCRLDQIRAGNTPGYGDLGPPCSIPGFIEVTEQQVVLLRETLKVRRKRQAEAYEGEKQNRADEAAAAEEDPGG